VGQFYFGQVCLVSWRLPVPEWAIFSRLGKISVIILLNILQIPFAGTHDSQVWSFDGVGDFLHFPFSGLELSN
jgi:hypothetical protein